MASHDDEFRLEAENLDLRRLLAKAGIDAAEQEVAKKLQRLILEELHHRVKNMLATVQAIASQSLRSADTLEQARSAIENRLAALSRVHDLLLKANWSEAMLNAVVKTAIEPFETKAAQQFSVHADTLKLSPNAVLPIAMVINELCTNAVKYGALSTPAGNVAIDASIDGNMLRFNWTEKNGPVVREPSRRSFGSKLMEHAFVSQLEAKASLKFAPGGVCYELEAPLDVIAPNWRA